MVSHHDVARTHCFIFILISIVAIVVTLVNYLLTLAVIRTRNFSSKNWHRLGYSIGILFRSTAQTAPVPKTWTEQTDVQVVHPSL